MIEVSGKTWARIGAVAFAAFAILVSSLSLRRDRAPTLTTIHVPLGQDLATDPLAIELHRCQALGQARASDPECLSNWGENRRRFLAPHAGPEAWAPAAPAVGDRP